MGAEIKPIVEDFLKYFDDMVAVLNTTIPAIIPISDEDKVTLEKGLAELNRIRNECYEASSINEMSRYIDVRSVADDWMDLKPVLESRSNDMLQEFVRFNQRRTRDE